MVVAQETEMKSLFDMDVIREIVDKLPIEERAIKSRWVYAKKYDAFGTLEEFKAGIVAKEFLEKYGVHYDKIFSPLAHSSSVRLLTAIAAGKGSNCTKIIKQLHFFTLI